jgi:hypothetical protein
VHAGPRRRRSVLHERRSDGDDAERSRQGSDRVGEARTSGRRQRQQRADPELPRARREQEKKASMGDDVEPRTDTMNDAPTITTSAAVRTERRDRRSWAATAAAAIMSAGHTT